MVRHGLARLAVLIPMVVELWLAGCGGNSSRQGGPTARGFVPEQPNAAVASAVTDRAVSLTPTEATQRAQPEDVNIVATARAHSCQATPPDKVVPYDNALPGMWVTWYGRPGLWLGSDDDVWDVSGGASIILYPLDAQQTPWISGHLIGSPSTQLQGVEIRDAFVGASLKYSARIAMFSFPNPGCWQLTVTQGSQSITFIVYVALASNARVQEQQALTTDYQRQVQKQRTTLIPYAPPPSCKVSPWVGPSARTLGSSTPMWWLDGQGIALASQWGVLWAGTETTNTVDWVLQAQPPQMTVSGHSLDSPTVALRGSEPFNWSDGNAQGFYTNLAFLTPGCWQIEARAGSETLHATVYVYPVACRRDPGTPMPSGCKPPAG